MQRADLKNTIDQIKREEVVQKWLKGLKESTKKPYLTALADFCVVTNKNPTKLLNITYQEQENRIPPWELQIDQWFVAYKDYCYERNYSKQTCQGRRAIVSSFFHMFKINTPTNLVRREKDKLIVKNERKGLIKQDIIDAINAAKSFKLKALILTQATSGMAQIDVLKLALKQFENGLIDIGNGCKICKISMRRTKTNQEHITFIGFEAVDLIQKYLQHERGEYDPEWALFSAKKGIKKAFTANGYNSAIKRLNKRLGWENNKWLFGKLTTHMFRKFFETQLTDSGMVDEHLRHFMGWKPKDPLKQKYYLANSEELQKSYIQHLGYLCLNDVDTLTIESKEYKELKEKYEKDAKARDDELEKLREQNELTRKLVEDLIRDMKSSE